MKQTITSLALILLVAACGTIKVSRVTNPDKLKDDYFYVLPKTALLLEVPLKKTVYTKGPFFLAGLSEDQKKICKAKFGLDTKIYNLLDASTSTTATTVYELDDVTYTLVAKPDFDKVFKIDASRKFLHDQNFSFTYANDGIASESELSSQNKTADLILKTFDGAISIASALKGSDAANSFAPAVALPSSLDDLTKLIKEYADFRSNNPLVGDPGIYKDKVAFIEKQIANCFAQSFYKIKTVTKPVQIYFSPNEKQTGDLKLFRLNTNAVEINSAYQNQCEVRGTGTFTFSAITGTTAAYSINLSRLTPDLGNSFDAYTGGATGYVYNIPANYNLIIKDDDGDAIVNQTIKLPQFGVMGSLSAKQSKVTVQFNTETGELKKVTGESKALSGETISGAAASVKGTIDEIKGDDETAKLEKEVKLLELKKKRQDLIGTVTE